VSRVGVMAGWGVRWSALNANGQREPDVRSDKGRFRRDRRSEVQDDGWRCWALRDANDWRRGGSGRCRRNPESSKRPSRHDTLDQLDFQGATKTDLVSKGGFGGREKGRANDGTLRAIHDIVSSHSEERVRSSIEHEAHIAAQRSNSRDRHSAPAPCQNEPEKHATRTPACAVRSGDMSHNMPYLTQPWTRY
jgi:hypothetical protein